MKHYLFMILCVLHKLQCYLALFSYLAQQSCLPNAVQIDKRAYVVKQII